MNPLFQRLLRLLLVVFIGAFFLPYLGLLALLHSSQERMIFPGSFDLPPLQPPPGWSDWTDPAGHYIGIHRSPANPRTDRSVLILHGNGDTVEVRTHLAEPWLAAGYSVHMLEYPGYGRRPGTASSDTLRSAVITAGHELTGHGVRLVVVGQSLGSGVAGALLDDPLLRPSIDALLLLAPFTDLATAGRANIGRIFGSWSWLIPVRLMLRHDLDLASPLVGWNGPVAIVAGTRDSFYPQAVRLYDIAAGPKLLVRHDMDHEVSGQSDPSAISFLLMHLAAP